MKKPDLVKQLANRINQPHYVESWINKIERAAYKKGYEDAIKKQCDIPVVSGWIFLAKKRPELKDKCYTVLDKYGNIEEDVLFGCSGFMNEPYGFFEGKIVKAKDIIAYR